jgi:peptide/nickel transport system substrate-binding protein
VTFHDGTPLTAEAIKFTFDRIKDPETKSSLPLGKLGTYQSTNVIDDLTAEVILESPYPGFFDGISQTWLAIVSPTAAELGEDFGRSPVGTGFMKFKEWVTNDHITLERNEDYNWGPSFWNHSGPAYLDQLTFVPVIDNPARLTAFESGDLHIIEQVPEQDFDRLKQSGEYQMKVSPNPGAPMTLFMNTQLGPTADINVRKAILHGMDHQQLIDIALFNLYEVVEGPISPTTKYYSPKVEGLYPYDVELAAGLLEEAGWVMGADGVREKDGERLVLDFVNWPPGESVVLTAQGLLKPLGIEIVAQIFDQPTRVQMGHNGEGHIFMNTVVDTDPGGVGLFYHSKNMGSFNWPRFASPEIDAALDQQQVETDPALRAQLLEDFQLLVMENALIYPAYLFARLHGVAANVQGFRVSPLGTYPYFYEMSLA